MRLLSKPSAPLRSRASRVLATTALAWGLRSLFFAV
jgi:hypothetical protein